MHITLRIEDRIYRQAIAAAAREGMTLTRFIEEALTLRIERSAEYLGDLNPAMENLSSDESRSRQEEDREIKIRRLRRLFERADERDHFKEGSAGPFVRENLYAERLDRFR